MIATQDSTLLLRRYACDGSEDAFAELVSRHLDLVYSAAARCCYGDEALAGEVAQRVFVDLARKFRPEGRGTISAAEGVRSVPAWLHRHTCFVAASAIRSESRRRLREMHAMELQPQVETNDWSRVAPVLEEALSELADPDRDAVVLRFFEDEPYARIGSALEC
ncbi:MAG: sigma-70 family RNA polymerase sigma factor, partial [Verrucomicrobiales bacterium]|nr:sigma-70 family RNA polymerase sigma factor [Verrucomicrobiales bacterium]